jgi:hypothetical protein
VLFATLLWVGNSQDVLSAQEEYRSGDYVIRPAVCWTTVMEFYDRGAFPYYSVDGYFFDANPFQTTRMLDGNRSMIMRSSKGRWLTDVTGRYRWTDARIRVDCFIREYFGGLVQQPYATAAYELGVVEPVSTACGPVPEDPWGGEYITDIGDPQYDPYDPDQVSTADDCSSGSGDTGSGENGGWNCWYEYMVIEISYDGGKTWHLWWEGWGRVCEENET